MTHGITYELSVELITNTVVVVQGKTRIRVYTAQVSKLRNIMVSLIVMNNSEFHLNDTRTYYVNVTLKLFVI